ncbi:hypothetical protein RhiirA5_433284 [Rhizophagus irregularis]|uniref:Uncharacterized protein n=1 Tax=Rhizophagus irregularis TaxID=588596 RepID=A0A2N0NS41_9GLOM|nr:hypothetical protein RhiirA5_433284 [Rhizophagus irregularis]
MTLRLKQLQNKFWIKDNIVSSVFPFDNNFYKKLFYSKRNYDNWILENIKILKNNNIDISINNKLNIEKYKITGDQLIGISNLYLINWCTLKLKSFREDTRNYNKPKKWYKELQNIVTIDRKTLKPEYKMSAIFHFKGSNDIKIGVLIKTSGIDEQNNLIIGHLNVINNIDYRSSTIQLQKCLECELDNIEQLNQKTFNCNILVNANDYLIISVQSNNAINDAHYRSILNNNNLKAILQINLLDITDLSYNDFLFKNN